MASNMKALEKMQQPANEAGSELNNELVIADFSDVVSSVVSKAQFDILRGRTPRSAIKKRPGKGGKTFSYVPHGYVTAVLNKAFGFAWDWEIVPQEGGKLFIELPAQPEQSRPNGSIIVQGKLTVRIHNPKKPTEIMETIVKMATGEKEILKGMTWGGMIKSAESDAFKKAATRLGIANDLYWQDTEGDYMPEAEPEPEPPLLQAIVDALPMAKAFVDANPSITPPELKSKLAEAGHSLTMPEVGKMISELAKEVPTQIK